MSSINQAIYFFKYRPISVVVWKAYCKLFEAHVSKYEEWKRLILNKSGIEIGGPSRMFTSKGFIPLYPCIKSLDGVNFSSNTIWEGKLQEGDHFSYEGKTGYQFIAEGTDLSRIPDSNYEFLLSCNNLEHIANPLKALTEWKRVIGNGGIIILVLPRKHSNFDLKRPVTVFEHIVHDFKNDVGEDDLTHLEEILKLHYLQRDPEAGTPDEFKARALSNFTSRSLHHHVFDKNLLQKMVEYVGMRMILYHTSPTDYIVAAVK